MPAVNLACERSETAVMQSESRSGPNEASIGLPSPVLSRAINRGRAPPTDGRTTVADQATAVAAGRQMNSSCSTEQSNCMSTATDDDDANFCVARVRRKAVAATGRHGSCAVNQPSPTNQPRTHLNQITKVCLCIFLFHVCKKRQICAD